MTHLGQHDPLQGPESDLADVVEKNCQKRLPSQEKFSLLRAPPHLRTDGRVVDRARLESVFTVKGDEGSNPSLSAIFWDDSRYSY